MPGFTSRLLVWSFLISVLISVPVSGVVPPGGESEGTKGGERPRTVEDLLRRVEPWVVAIRVERRSDVGRSRFQPRFVPRAAPDYFKRPKGLVTGLLVDRQGLVLTSHYNVAGELESVEVLLPGGEKRTAKLLASDRMDDLALLKIEGEEPAVPADRWREPPWASNRPGTGKVLFAVGRSPDPERLTVTQGIVSATGRNGNRTFQTDAKLNYGNVGGPLIDLDGRIVGISAFVGHIFPQWGLNSGVGFGTSVSTLREVLPRLRQGEDIEPPEAPFLGVRSNPDDLGGDGARVAEVIDDSAAEAAGLVQNDVILELEGKEITNFNHLRRLLFDYRVGDTVEIKVRRGNDQLTFKVKLKKRPF